MKICILVGTRVVLKDWTCLIFKLKIRLDFAGQGKSKVKGLFQRAFARYQCCSIFHNLQSQSQFQVTGFRGQDQDRVIS